MRNKTLILPTISDDNIVIQFTATFSLNKDILITVPSNFIAIIYMNENAFGKIVPCSELSLLKYIGKNFVRENVKIAFVRTNNFSSINWGFGDIFVKNNAINGGVRMGANGKYLLKINDPIKVIKTFGLDENINIEAITGKTKPIIVSIGKPLLNKYFSQNDISIYDINSHTNDFKKLLLDEIKKEDEFKNFGLELISLTINGIHINDEDLEGIKNKSNESNKLILNAENSQLEVLKNDLLDSIKNIDFINTNEQIKYLIDKVEQLSNNQINDTVIDEIDNLRAAVTNLINTSNSESNTNLINKILQNIDEINEKINNQQNFNYDEQLENIKNQVESSLSVKIENSLNVIQDILANAKEEQNQDKIPLYDSAKDEWLKTLKLTTDLQIEKAKSDDDYAGVAGLIYSNVEYNLINNYKIPHKSKVFYMTEDEFNTMSKKIEITNQRPFSAYYKPRHITFSDINGNFVEMPLEFRFIKAGLSISQACEVAKDWTILNTLRHRSKENDEKLKSALNERRFTKKDFLRCFVNKLRNFKLYTRD